MEGNVDVYRIAVDLLREHKVGLNHGTKYAIFPTNRMSRSV